MGFRVKSLQGFGVYYTLHVIKTFMGIVLVIVPNSGPYIMALLRLPLRAAYGLYKKGVGSFLAFWDVPYRSSSFEA